jgi:hypothetical protein
MSGFAPMLRILAYRIPLAGLGANSTIGEFFVDLAGTSRSSVTHMVGT